MVQKLVSRGTLAVETEQASGAEDQNLNDNGFVLGLTEETSLEDEMVEAGDGDEDGTPNSEIPEELVQPDARYFDDLESAKAALTQEAQSQQAAAHEAFMSAFESELGTSLGLDGDAVVLPFDGAQNPCQGVGYLHETFVHADMATGTFVCRPCHHKCTGHCAGPDEANCLELKTFAKRQGRSAYAESFQKHISSMLQQDPHGVESLLSVGATHGSDPVDSDSEQPQNLTNCLQEASCTSETQDITVTVQANLSLANVEMVWATNQSGNFNLTDPLTLRYEMQKMLQQSLKDNGFIPGLTEEAPLEDETVEAGDGDEDGSSNSETPEELVQPDIEQASHPGQGLLQRTSEHAELARLNRTSRAVSTAVKNRIKGACKDHVRTVAKRQAKDYAKRELKAWVNAQDGPCLDALDLLVGASQEIYGCFKENYARLESAFCQPPEKHGKLLSTMKGAQTSANAMARISDPLKSLPYVGPAARTLNRVAKAVLTYLRTPVYKLDQHMVRQYGPRYENPDCCPPFPANGCSSSPGALYRCASCNRGGMCLAKRGCNFLRRLESKIDEWKQDHFDPIVEKVAGAVQYVQAGSNAVNSASFLFSCGFNHCSKVKQFTQKIMDQLRSSFTDKFCPIRVPSIPMPNIGALQTVLDWLIKIGSVFHGIGAILGKWHCISVPIPQAQWRTKCWRVCLPCCRYHGRRRWTGSVRCSSCCHNTCVPYLHAWIYMKRYCFSGMSILKGIGGFIQRFLGPVLSLIDRAIQFLLRPIQSLFNMILNKIGSVSLDINFPTLPNFEFSLPSLPAPQCGALSSYIR